MNKKKIINVGFVIIWMLIIFIFSSQTGIESQNVSDKLINKTVCINSCNFELISFLVRKSAHFILFFILGLLVLNCHENKKINILYSLLICLIYAFSDEIHQMFISSRSGELRDVFIDFIGSLLGILLTYKIKK